MDARLPISEVNDVLGLSLSTTEFHTVGGLVTARLRRLPKEGDLIVESGYCFRVVEATGRSITRIIVERDRPQVTQQGRRRWHISERSEIGRYSIFVDRAHDVTAGDANRSNGPDADRHVAGGCAVPGAVGVQRRGFYDA